MSNILFIKWDENDLVNFPILDEQHRGLIAMINSLFYFMQKGWDLKSLKPTILMLEQYIIFHLKTEESILLERGIPENDLKIIQEYRKTFLADLNRIVNNAINNHEPNELAKYIAKWWTGHKTEFHNKLEQYFVV
tara:strand:+ start:84382 stop:84786 length:405 start_codon:yes stop_codon:yes gene_type:complete